jgi:uncharacterized paraquat-inducible protein A
LAVGADRGCCERHDPAREADRLGYLLITVQRGSIGGDRERTRLYRMVEFIGRWSMLDVFVDAFVVAWCSLGR